MDKTKTSAEQEILAKKIASLLSESKTKFNEVDIIFFLAKCELEVCTRDII